MVGSCSADDFFALLELLKARGFRLSEGRQGDVYRLFADKAEDQAVAANYPNPLVRRGPGRPIGARSPVRRGALSADELEGGGDGLVNWP
jgi:hypothetical protein